MKDRKETPMQELFRRFGHLLPDIENEFLMKEGEVLTQADIAKSVCDHKRTKYSEFFNGDFCQDCGKPL